MLGTYTCTYIILYWYHYNTLSLGYENYLEVIIIIEVYTAFTHGTVCGTIPYSYNCADICIHCTKGTVCLGYSGFNARSVWSEVI